MMSFPFLHPNATLANSGNFSMFPNTSSLFYNNTSLFPGNFSWSPSNFSLFPDNSTLFFDNSTLFFDNCTATLKPSTLKPSRGGLEQPEFGTSNKLRSE